MLERSLAHMSGLLTGQTFHCLLLLTKRDYFQFISKVKHWILKGQSNRAVIWIKKLIHYSCITSVMINIPANYYSLLTNYF